MANNQFEQYYCRRPAWLCVCVFDLYENEYKWNEINWLEIVRIEAAFSSAIHSVGVSLFRYDIWIPFRMAGHSIESFFDKIRNGVRGQMVTFDGSV